MARHTSSAPTPLPAPAPPATSSAALPPAPAIHGVSPSPYPSVHKQRSPSPFVAMAITAFTLKQCRLPYNGAHSPLSILSRPILHVG